MSERSDPGMQQQELMQRSVVLLDSEFAKLLNEMLDGYAKALMYRLDNESHALTVSRAASLLKATRRG